MISFNDKLIWFCTEGVHGCLTMPQWFAWISIYLIVIAFGIGFYIGRKTKQISTKENK